MESRVQISAILPQAGFLALILAAGPLAVAQSGSFVISQHGNPVGTASFNFTSTASGYDSTSVVRIAMKGLDYALSKTEELSPAIASFNSATLIKVPRRTAFCVNSPNHRST